MRIFVTGASGWIGSAVVPELLGAGHEVVGLARSDASAQSWKPPGPSSSEATSTTPTAWPRRPPTPTGSSTWPFSTRSPSAATLPPPARPTAGPWRRWVRPWPTRSPLRARLGHDRADPRSGGHRERRPGPSPEVRANPAGRRAATALLTLSLRGIGVRSSVLRFPPTVHGDGDNGFMATFVGIARQRGVAGYVGDGANRWPAVHRSDAARLARLAVESAPAGSVLHAVADEGVAFREIAEAMGRHLDVPTASVSRRRRRALRHLGHFVGLDSPATAAITRDLLGWEPTGPSLLEDLEQDHYYRRV